MDYVSNFISQYGALFAQGTVDTLVMTLASTLFAYIIGVPLGVLLVITAKDGLWPQRALNTVLGWVVNVGRSIPFIILLVAIIPFTRVVVGTSLGVPGAIVPLTVAAIPFVGRMVEQSLAEVDGGLIEAAQSFGANTWQIVCKVMLRESLPSLVRGASITVITLFGYTAMAGAVGAGGIGDIAIRYGYQRYLGDVMIVSIVLCVVLVQVFQSIGDLVARRGGQARSQVVGSALRLVRSSHRRVRCANEWVSTVFRPPFGAAFCVCLCRLSMGTPWVSFASRNAARCVTHLQHALV